MNAKLRKIALCIGAATLTAYYLATALFIIIGNLRGHNVILTLNQHREGPLELAYTIITLPLVAYFIREAKRAITDTRARADGPNALRV